MQAFIPSTIMLDVVNMSTHMKPDSGEENALREIKELRRAALTNPKEQWVNWQFQQSMQVIIYLLELLVDQYTEGKEMSVGPIERAADQWVSLSQLAYNEINDEDASALKFIVKTGELLRRIINSDLYNGDIVYVQPEKFDSGAKKRYGDFVEK